MPILWSEMNTEEKLDDLHATVQRLSEIMNQSAQRGNRKFSEIDRRLSAIEAVFVSVQTAVAALRDKEVGGNG